MRYPALTIDEGRGILQQLRAGIETQQPTVQWLGWGDERFDESLIDDLVSVVNDVRRVMGEPGESAERRYWAVFEGRAAAAVHETLEGLPIAVAVDPKFWVWLLFGSRHEGPRKTVTWRHGRGNSPYDAQDSNYGVTTALHEGFWSRLWLRADIGRDLSRSDPYELVTRGDQDLWRSHIFRQQYAQVRPIAHNLLLFQYPDEHPDKARVSNPVIREMVKELRRRQAVMAYELLSEDDARALIEDVYASILAR